MTNITVQHNDERSTKHGFPFDKTKNICGEPKHTDTNKRSQATLIT